MAKAGLADAASTVATMASAQRATKVQADLQQRRSGAVLSDLSVTLDLQQTLLSAVAVIGPG